MKNLYTIEVENRLLGSRQHRKASKYPFDEACSKAKAEASRSRKFATYNVLDYRGQVIASYVGEH
jgi:hypothetical protein